MVQDEWWETDALVVRANEVSTIGRISSHETMR
jgi:hypothetical protein